MGREHIDEYVRILQDTVDPEATVDWDRGLVIYSEPDLRDGNPVRIELTLKQATDELFKFYNIG